MDLRILTTSRPKLVDVATRVAQLVVQGDIACEKTRNKGAAGLLCERLTGIPTSSAHIDCLDGEVKVFPLKKLKSGKLVPKETVAVTMVNNARLTEEADFATSHCGTKLKHVLFVPYIRVSAQTIRFFPAVDFALEGAASTELERDYNEIRKGFVESGTLASSVGRYMQTRTKGAGNGAPKTRAFYLRTSFVSTFVPATW